MFELETAKLIAWIEANKREKGAYYSNANHAIWGVINDNILPYSFHYYGVILGYLNLYRKLGNEVFLDRAKAAGDFLCSLQEKSGKFKFDKFEYETGKNQGFTLIHNVLPSISLIRLSKETNNQKYFKTAKKNIIWAFSRLWNGEYLSGCINQDVVAAEALATLSIIENKRVYKKRAEKLADWCLNYQIKDGELKGGFIRGLNWTMGIHETNFVIPWYDALTALSYFNLYRITEKEEYIESVKSTLGFLKNNFNSDGLIHSYIRKNGKWNKVREPVLVSPSGVVLYLFDRFGIKYDDKILKKQLPSGAFPSALGYGDFRDHVPTLGWNQFMFLYMTSKIEDELPQVEIEKTGDSPKLEHSGDLVVRGKVKGAQSGYADLIRGYIVMDTQKLKNGTFSFYGKKDYYRLRIRPDNGSWKLIEIAPEDDFLEININRNPLSPALYITESVLTGCMKNFFFNEKMFNFLAKTRNYGRRLLKF